MKMTSRQRILELIRRHQKITTSQLNSYIEMSPANIRHHLSSLVADGLIETSETRGKDRGRPENIYSPSKSLSDDGLDQLLENLLNELRHNLDGGELTSLLIKVAEDWAELHKSMQLRILPQILANCVDQLNKLKYHAQWEASRDGPLVRFDNCPYERIIHAFPELCKLDKILLDKMIGLNFIQISKLEKDEKGLMHCSFIGRQEQSLYPARH